MTTIVTADLHASANPRDAYRWLFIEDTLLKMVEDYGARRVLILGDLTETKDRHAAGLVNRLVDALARLAEAAHVYVLKGNHDYVAEDAPFFRFLQHIPRVHWINAPTPLKLKGLGDCLFLPHTRNPEDWVDHMFDSFDCFFLHQTFNGADLGGVRAEGGAFDPHVFAGKKFRAISGDVHAPQDVGPVTYVGAPYTVDFGDAYDPRVLILNGDEMRSVPVPGPQKRLVVVRRGSGYPDDIAPGDIVKMRIEVSASHEISRAELRAQARRWADAAGVHLHTAQVVAPEPGRAGARAADASRATDADLIRAHARRMKKGRATLATGLKIAEEVQ